MRILAVGIEKRSLMCLTPETEVLLIEKETVEQHLKAIEEFGPEAVLYPSTFGPYSLPVTVQLPKLQLNERQSEILVMLHSGLRNTEIASHIGLSARTIKAELSKLFDIFDVTNRTELLGSAFDLGALDAALVSRPLAEAKNGTEASKCGKLPHLRKEGHSPQDYGG
jgi:DNA-binding CsgD family transcriptional regulator